MCFFHFPPRLWPRDAFLLESKAMAPFLHLELSIESKFLGSKVRQRFCAVLRRLLDTQIPVLTESRLIHHQRLQTRHVRPCPVEYGESVRVDVAPIEDGRL